MNYTSNPLGPPDNEHPNKHDFDELDIIYAHLDSTTTIGASARNSIATEIDHNNPSTWGQLFKQASGGRKAICELDLGGGSKTVTFVMWALQGKR
jgi:hypothetical protein